MLLLFYRLSEPGPCNEADAIILELTFKPQSNCKNTFEYTPVLNWQTVSDTANSAFCLPQNLVFGHLPHRTPLNESFRF